MSEAIYYSDLYKMTDPFRREKYYKLLLASLKNDMSKWNESVSDSISRYTSPDYNGTTFKIYIRKYESIAFVSHKTPIITDQPSELISDKFTSELEAEVKQLREKIFTPDIYEIEKSIGNQHNRKEKLEFLEIEQLKELIEDTYQDWLNNSSDVTAKLIAKIIYSYRRNEEKFELWKEKFGDNELIMKELKKLKG